ncbi:sugar phosphate nucleotidyltransferase [Priestia endophytica]|uniref:sugar phosphate nucleotidyltransferase n=1 Tax=Priestia endophytica TaxID=135735 RepID=UPI00124D4F2A|nr:sugar phosphate nucleotidyltransferase [Priestia endophytica]KAB2488087.1 NTP transferase domain-containing protein [Priestia endophytica]
MKGIILAGGTGTRLKPLTTIINKHLLPVGPYPMIYWPIIKLKEAGITEILLVINGTDQEMFETLLGDGRNLGVNLSFAHQKGPNGIADGIGSGRNFVGKKKFIVILGDNLFEDSLVSYIESFRLQEKGAKVLLKQVDDPQRYGIAELDTEKKIITSIEEKPIHPKSDLCAVGIYMYDSSVFEYIDSTVPSGRGELEITDVNNMYIKNDQLSYDFLNGWWIDAGTHKSLYTANSFYYCNNREGNNE